MRDLSPFLWKGQPSTLGLKLMVGLQKPVDATNITFSTRSSTSSIASAEKLKQQPGTGRSATV
jgi:hypothetical protein